MAEPRSAASHPLCLVAVAVLLVNDHVLKGAIGGGLTGKLSDLAWLVVAPAVVWTLLRAAGLGSRAAEGSAVAGVGLAFTALQLWPPLGGAWVDVLGGSHTPDPTDLWCLPALALAPLCWRRGGRRFPLAMPVAALACVATTDYDLHGYCSAVDARYPCGGTTDWDPNLPLALVSAGTLPDLSRPGVLDRIEIIDADGRALTVVTEAIGAHTVVICPVGGLLPDADYTWTVPGDGAVSSNHLVAEGIGPAGRLTFHTAASSSRSPGTSSDPCGPVTPLDYNGFVCGYEIREDCVEDPGDSGPDAADTAVAETDDTASDDTASDTAGGGQ